MTVPSAQGAFEFIRNLIDDAVHHPQDAKFMCLACPLAYLPANEAAPKFRDFPGLNATLVSVDNTQSDVAEKGFGDAMAEIWDRCSDWLMPR